MDLKNKTENLLFDFDGTLIDSAPAILAAYAAALHETGVAPCIPLDSNLIGPPLAETLMRISGSSDVRLIALLIEKFQHHYDTAGVAATFAYPGVAAMLEYVRGAGIDMHISTNKRLSVTRAIVERLDWRDYFVSIYALDMVEPRLAGKKQLLCKQLSEQQFAPDQAIYIGDKHEDGLAAAANGLAFCYASWGYGGLQREQLDVSWNWLGQPSDLCHSIVSSAISVPA